jgi:hypothetical protein
LLLPFPNDKNGLVSETLDGRGGETVVALLSILLLLLFDGTVGDDDEAKLSVWLTGKE